jgi:hypothetical protein
MMRRWKFSNETIEIVRKCNIDIYELEALEDDFNEIDKDCSGFVTADEIKAMLQKERKRVKSKLEKVPSEEEVQTIMRHFDRNQDGKVSLEEYIAAMCKHPVFNPPTPDPAPQKTITQRRMSDTLAPDPSCVQQERPWWEEERQTSKPSTYTVETTTIENKDLEDVARAMALATEQAKKPSSTAQVGEVSVGSLSDDPFDEPNESDLHKYDPNDFETDHSLSPTTPGSGRRTSGPLTQSVGKFGFSSDEEEDTSPSKHAGRRALDSLALSSGEDFDIRPPDQTSWD